MLYVRFKTRCRIGIFTLQKALADKFQKNSYLRKGGHQKWHFFNILNLIAQLKNISKNMNFFVSDPASLNTLKAHTNKAI